MNTRSSILVMGLTSLIASSNLSVCADEGMWLFNDAPRKLLSERCGEVWPLGRGGVQSAPRCDGCDRKRIARENRFSERRGYALSRRALSPLPIQTLHGCAPGLCARTANCIFWR